MTVTGPGHLLMATAGEGGFPSVMNIHLMVPTRAKIRAYLSRANHPYPCRFSTGFVEKAFQSARSLGMHRYHQHALELNQERIVGLQSKWRGWTEMEDSELRKHADFLWEVGILKNLLILLHGLFQHRSTEALKKRLQIIKWEPQETNIGGRKISSFYFIEGRCRVEE